jgi:hypothetical protein
MCRSPVWTQYQKQSSGASSQYTNLLM